MKKFAALLLALALVLSLTAALAQDEKPTLTISTWSANIDTITANVFKPFEEANNCTIVLDLGNNAPRLAKVTENPEQFDIVYFSDLYVQKCIEADLFMPIDKSRIEGLEDLYPFCQDPSNGYGPGYTVTGFGILYDPAVIGKTLTSWADLWDPDVASQLVIPDISMTSGPYMIEVAGKVAGVDPAENEDPAFEKIKELIGMGAGFYANSGDLAAKFEQGEVAVAVCQDFNASTIRGAKEGLEYVIVPAEGTYLGINSVNIVKGSKNVDLAYKFISWLISYDVQYKDALDKVEAPANTKVVLTPEQAEGICYGETVALSGAPNWALYNERNAAWIERYNEEIYQ